jgi:hypothetical protein
LSDFCKEVGGQNSYITYGNEKQRLAKSANQDRDANYHVAQILKVVVSDDLSAQLRCGGGKRAEKQFVQALEGGCRHPVLRQQAHGRPSCL